ncbi:hypothetical protein ACH5RR_002238 [Cinchona calisaya]|uniref:Uncharacterized protein n=1 Tax=Cinchona calisaya TaxID=153742 RepID=A0ABD3B706_9GENT
MSEPKPTASTKPLFKTKSWSLDIQREAAWLKQKRDYRRMQRCRGSSSRSKSFTDGDLDELRACFELGFGLDSPDAELDPKLSSVFPALGFYHAHVNKQYNNSLSRSSSSMTVGSDSDTTSSTSTSGISPSCSLFHHGDDPEMKKVKLRQWAKVVACIVSAKHLPNRK